VIYLDLERPDEAIKAGWIAYRERVPTLEEAYHSAVSKWTAIAVCDDEKVIGVLLADHGVIHLGIIPEYRGRWASKRIIREMLKYGKRTTLMDHEDPKFIERIGFRKTEAGYEFPR
jgi:GNAT superfamily N-acetyltransferase